MNRHHRAAVTPFASTPCLRKLGCAYLASAVLMAGGCKERPAQIVIGTSDPTVAIEPVKIQSEPYRWGGTSDWHYRILWTDYPRMQRSIGPEQIIQAMNAGMARRLDFGTNVCVLAVVPAIDSRGTSYRVRVLDGPQSGLEGWVDFASINGNRQPGIKSTTGCGPS
jgi:hypothetical protein